MRRNGYETDMDESNVVLHFNRELRLAESCKDGQDCKDG